jgi:hypothetical protein
MPLIYSMPLLRIVFFFPFGIGVQKWLFEVCEQSCIIRGWEKVNKRNKGFHLFFEVLPILCSCPSFGFLSFIYNMWYLFGRKEGIYKMHIGNRKEVQERNEVPNKFSTNQPIPIYNTFIALFSHCTW